MSYLNSENNDKVDKNQIQDIIVTFSPQEFLFLILSTCTFLNTNKITIDMIIRIFAFFVTYRIYQIFSVSPKLCSMKIFAYPIVYILYKCFSYVRDVLYLNKQLKIMSKENPILLELGSYYYTNVILRTKMFGFLEANKQNVCYSLYKNYFNKYNYKIELTII